MRLYVAEVVSYFYRCLLYIFELWKCDISRENPYLDYTHYDQIEKNVQNNTNYRRFYYLNISF